jgi:twinfilin
MSHQTGIRSNEALRNFFAKSKEGHVRMIKVIINDKEELALDTYKNVESDWKIDYNECVLKHIDTKIPCYIFFRLDERNSTGFLWLFISWSPDFAPIKLKMLYAATKSTLKLEFGAGQLKDELFGTVREDVSLDGYLRHLKAQLAPAPLTNREEELELLKQNENLTRINVDTKQKTLQGVMFPVEESAIGKLDEFKRGKLDYLQFSIDIPGERILLEKHREHLNVDSLAHEVPKDKGRFHLYRYKHIHEGEQTKPNIFIYSMPGFSCPIKERMLYSSCKNELLSYLKTQANIEISKTFEVSEPSELNQQYLLDELHPKKANEGLKFEKPKGPTARGPKRVTRPASNGAEVAND